MRGTASDKVFDSEVDEEKLLSTENTGGWGVDKIGEQHLICWELFKRLKP